MARGAYASAKVNEPRLTSGAAGSTFRRDALVLHAVRYGRRGPVLDVRGLDHDPRPALGRRERLGRARDGVGPLRDRGRPLVRGLRGELAPLGEAHGSDGA